ncbi:hypothetical protein [Marinicauda pacifica]|uniref:hypothetical protein n=1 Tax=Marinicauda pacifica TaxID=1133559 RepID=UPI0035C869FF
MMAQKRKTGGRKAGVPNKVTALARERIEQEADPIGLLTRIAKGEDIDGEQPTLDQRAHAARWLGAKIVPDAKEMPISFEVGQIESPKDALAAVGQLITATGQGEMMPGEAKSAMDLLTAFLRAYEANELETRVKALEEKR